MTRQDSELSRLSDDKRDAEQALVAALARLTEAEAWREDVDELRKTVAADLEDEDRKSYAEWKAAKRAYDEAREAWRAVK